MGPLWLDAFLGGFILDFGAFALITDQGWSELPFAIGLAAAGLTLSFGLAPWLIRRPRNADRRLFWTPSHR